MQPQRAVLMPATVITTKTASRQLYVVDLVHNSTKVSQKRNPRDSSLCPQRSAYAQIETEGIAWSDSPDEANAFACQQWRNHGAFREPHGGFAISPTMLPPPPGTNLVRYPSGSLIDEA